MAEFGLLRGSFFGFVFAERIFVESFGGCEVGVGDVGDGVAGLGDVAEVHADFLEGGEGFYDAVELYVLETGVVFDPGVVASITVLEGGGPGGALVFYEGVLVVLFCVFFEVGCEDWAAAGVWPKRGFSMTTILFFRSGILRFLVF